MSVRVLRAFSSAARPNAAAKVASSTYQRVLTLDNINPLIRDTRYDVRGDVYLAAVKRTNEGKEVIYTNIGNPHSLGQQPVTFTRQVLSLLMAPFLMDHPNVDSMFPPDAIARAKTYLKHMKGGVGAYSDSKGNPYIRQEIADFIMQEFARAQDEEPPNGN